MRAPDRGCVRSSGGFHRSALGRWRIARAARSASGSGPDAEGTPWPRLSPAGWRSCRSRPLVALSHSVTEPNGGNTKAAWPFPEPGTVCQSCDDCRRLWQFQPIWVGPERTHRSYRDQVAVPAPEVVGEDASRTGIATLVSAAYLACWPGHAERSATWPVPRSSADGPGRDCPTVGMLSGARPASQPWTPTPIRGRMGQGGSAAERAGFSVVTLDRIGHHASPVGSRSRPRIASL